MVTDGGESAKQHDERDGFEEACWTTLKACRGGEGWLSSRDLEQLKREISFERNELHESPFFIVAPYICSASLRKTLHPLEMKSLAAEIQYAIESGGVPWLSEILDLIRKRLDPLSAADSMKTLHKILGSIGVVYQDESKKAFDWESAIHRVNHVLIQRGETTPCHLPPRPMTRCLIGHFLLTLQETIFPLIPRAIFRE